MIRHLAPALLATLALGCAAAPPKEYDETRIEYGKTPQPYFIRKTKSPKEYSDRQQHPRDAIYHHALVDEDGRELVPMDWGWSGIELINPGWATGKRYWDPTFKIVRLPSGAIEETPYVGYGWWSYYDSPVKHIHMISRPRWEENRFDVTFVDAAGRPTREYKDLGGPTVTKEGYVSNRLFRPFGSRLLCMDTTMPDGNAVSQLVTFDGLQAGPILPRILTYIHLPAFNQAPPSLSKYDAVNPQHREWGWTVGKLDVPGLPDARFVQPMGPEGQPLPLPAGAIGLIPLTWKTSVWRENGEYIPFHSGWAIVFPTDKGLRYALGLGTAPDVLAKADSLPRYDGLLNIREYKGYHGPEPLLAVKKADQPSWELVVTDTLATFLSAPPNEVLPTSEALLAYWERLKKEAHAKWVEAEKRRKAEEEEKQRKERELYIATIGPHFRNVLNGIETPGRVWTLKPIAQELGQIEQYRAFVARKLQEEAVRPTPYANYWISESRELGSKAHQALLDKLENDASEARLKDAERKRVEYDNWVKFARAAEEARISANSSSANPAMSGYTEQYKRNLEEWNKGRLNWFVPQK